MSIISLYDDEPKEQVKQLSAHNNYKNCLLHRVIRAVSVIA